MRGGQEPCSQVSAQLLCNKTTALATAERTVAIATLASSARLPPIGKQPGRRFGAISQMRGVAILAFSHCE
ncbi:hypothetical protein NY99_07675 [Xanthomonas phaseoli pv. phaseoli]|nr:hypothetical protein A9D66_06180 [Xanthomonas citri pv. glycines str. 12-2]KGU56606.1 hypothetical protein NY99_07675 [Xanthomonas phaseoli pv. phaseoli]KKY08188.1 hypothetical protein QQ30_24480 [Xanthomonas phaseoli pv. phaseoli]